MFVWKRPVTRNISPSKRGSVEFILEPTCAKPTSPTTYANYDLCQIILLILARLLFGRLVWVFGVHIILIYTKI